MQWLIDFDRQINLLSAHEQVFYLNVLVLFINYPILLLLFKLSDEKYTIKEFTRFYFTIGTIYILWFCAYIFNLFAQHSSGTNLWNPYSFGGIPSYALGGVGARWWNHIWVVDNFAKDVFTNIIHLNPFTLLFILLGVWLWKYKKIWIEVVLLFLLTISLKI